MLLLLSGEPCHGYGLMEGLGELGFGDYPIDFSGVYRTLRSLEDDGMVFSDWDLEVSGGPPRRVYTITDEGRAHLRAWVDDLRDTDTVLHAFLKAYDKRTDDS